MLLGIIIGVLLGMIYYPSVEIVIQFFAIKSWKEFEKFKGHVSENITKSKIMFIILGIIRLPLLIIIVIPVFIHAFRLAKN